MSENMRYLVDKDDDRTSFKIAQRKRLKKKIMKNKGRRKNNWEREAVRNGRI